MRTLLRAVALVAAAGLLIGLAGSATAQAPRAAAATTTITIRMSGCDGCWIRAVNNRSDAPVRHVGPRVPVSGGVVVLTVPTASTVGMVFDVTRPDEGEGDADWGWDLPGYVFVAIQQEGIPPGTPVSPAQATAAERASPCWAGTAEPTVTLDVRARIVDVLTLGLDDDDETAWVPVPTPAAWLSPAQAALAPFWEPVKGALIADEWPDCETSPPAPTDGRVVARVRGAGYASDIAVGPRGLFGYAVSSWGVEPIKLGAATAAGVIPSSASDGIAFSPDGRRAYTNAWFARGLHVIDLRRQRVIRTLSTPGRAGPPVVSPDGRFLYAPVRSMSVIGAFQARSGRLVREMPVPGSGRIEEIAISPDGRTLYTLRGGATLSALDTGSGGVIASTALTLGGSPVTASALAVTPDGQRLLLTSPTRSVAWAITVPGFAEAGVWPIQGAPHDVVVNPQGTRAYVATYGIQTIDLTAGVVRGRLDLPRPAARAEQDNARRQRVSALGVSPDGRTLLAATDTRWTFVVAVSP